MSPSPFPDRDTVARHLSQLGEGDRNFLILLMENTLQADNLFDGLEFYLEQAAAAPFLNSLKLEKCGEWLGHTAPDRMQIKLNEIARSSQHPAYTAFRTGLHRSGGLARAYPPAKI